MQMQDGCSLREPGSNGIWGGGVTHAVHALHAVLQQHACKCDEIQYVRRPGGSARAIMFRGRTSRLSVGRAMRVNSNGPALCVMLGWWG